MTFEEFHKTAVYQDESTEAPPADQAVATARVARVLFDWMAKYLDQEDKWAVAQLIREALGLAVLLLACLAVGCVTEARVGPGPGDASPSVLDTRLPGAGTDAPPAGTMTGSCDGLYQIVTACGDGTGIGFGSIVGVTDGQVVVTGGGAQGQEATWSYPTTRCGFWFWRSLPDGLAWVYVEEAVAGGDAAGTARWWGLGDPAPVPLDCTVRVTREK